MVYPVYFGRGCSEAFKEIYRKAKEEHSICSSFGDDESERAPRKKKGSGKVESYVIKVALNGQCYRHIQISKYAPLGVLSEVILETFGFDDDHCHAFLWITGIGAMEMPIIPMIWMEEAAYPIGCRFTDLD